MHSDLTFITNEANQTLKQRFEVLIKNTRFFDCLVGYFFTSGFYTLYPSLEDTEKIRILIGISTSGQPFDLLQSATLKHQEQIEFSHSHAETKQEYENLIEREFENSEDVLRVEQSVNKFIEWIKNQKLEIRAYPSRHIHAKLYIMTFVEGDRDVGRVITGSSNFTQAGLIDNLEFNVELKGRADYEFAKAKFEELWQNSVDVSEKYIQTINNKTWLNQTITPYELYLKFLYEYFKDELNQTEYLFLNRLPPEFLRLTYQEQAVLNAMKILESYGGVFISDVVGLGKTYIAAMLSGQLNQRTLVIAPPILLDKRNPGSWPNVFFNLRVPSADFESIGKLDAIVQRGVDKYDVVIIDESHRFRTETNISYELMAEICRGKKVILVSATPHNNSPKDILSQIKLFQKARKSTIPNVPDLEWFFDSLLKKLIKLDRQRNYTQYMEVVRENAKEIREKVLKYLMVRRTRTEIKNFFAEDLKKNKLKFPDVEKPVPLYYELNEEEDKIFNDTIKLITHQMKYCRYTPTLPQYFKQTTSHPEQLAQSNLSKIMKVLLVKRLESSFFAFRKTLDRFIHTYKLFINTFDNKKKVYVSKKYTDKIFEFLENDDDEAIQRLLDEEKAEEYSADDFTELFRKDLENDYKILINIRNMWQKVKRDPKLLKFLNELSHNKILKDNKIILFTESKETAEYLTQNIEEKLPKSSLCYTGSSSSEIHDNVLENFDARAQHPKDEYRILVSTEVMSEGVNLHRSNIVINYDIPWNPTRLMQRVGRINRVDTKHKKIYIFNFFPTKQADNQIKLREAAEAKIHAFLTLLGDDAELLTEGEPIGSHELFNRLMSTKTILGEDEFEESELKYLKEIESIRDKKPDLFEKIKKLPKKARSAKTNKERSDSLLTYFRRGKLQKFYLADSNTAPQELDFLTAAKLLESTAKDPRQKLPEKYYELLSKNKEAFVSAITEAIIEPRRRSGRDNTATILSILKATMKNTQQLTEDQERYLKKVMTQLEEGGLPKQTIKKTREALKNLKKELLNPLKVIAILHTHIPERLLERHYAEYQSTTSDKREVILSMYFTK